MRTRQRELCGYESLDRRKNTGQRLPIGTQAWQPTNGTLKANHNQLRKHELLFSVADLRF